MSCQALHEIVEQIVSGPLDGLYELLVSLHKLWTTHAPQVEAEVAPGYVDVVGVNDANEWVHGS